ncbi:MULTISPECIES: hypothetical protein [Vibrio]|uniref:hypothetical protein n=1 Tax=Vibrio TaxID=662 RepID=UPI000EFC4989|nr:hypothetical protein [Vibrio sp. Evd11]
MLNIYVAIAYVSALLATNQKKIADQLQAIGTASYVAGMLELIKLNINIDAMLLIVIGMLFTFLASKISKR